MSNDDVKNDVQKLAAVKPNVDQLKEKIAVRVERLEFLNKNEKGKDEERKSTYYQETKGTLEMLQKNKKAVLGAKTQVELVYQLGEMKSQAETALQDYRHLLKTEGTYQTLEDLGLLLKPDRSNVSNVERNRKNFKEENGQYFDQDRLATLEQLEAAASYSKSIFNDQKEKLVERAESLGIKNPKKTVDDALKIQGMVEKAKQSKEGGTSLPYAPQNEPSVDMGR